MGGNDDWIFSFNNICELLDLDPDTVRAACWRAEFLNRF